MASVLPLEIFPGFTSFGVVSPAVREIATVFNAEGLAALSDIPESSVAWADVGTRVTPGALQVKIPVQLTSLLGFEPMEGERKYHPVTLAAVTVKPAPWSMGIEWPIQIAQSGIAELSNFYGVAGLGANVVQHARAMKADIVASIISAGFTNSALGVTAKALTIEQPGNANGLPLFVDATQTKHYANPLDSRSTRFANLFLGAGTFSAAFGNMLTNMSQVPHPSKANMTLGLGVTDVIGPTHMLIPFYQMAVQSLSLQTTTSPGNLAAATTNIHNRDITAAALASMGQVIPAGLSPWRFWIAPQLDAHPYVVANPTKHMWVAVANKRGGAWCELAGPSTTFTPTITLLGDGTEEARKTRKVRMFGDLDAGAAAGLPHFAQMYFETTPS